MTDRKCARRPDARPVHRFLAGAALIASFAAPSAAVELFPESELRPGLKGHVRTVVQGNTVEEIGIEILGVLDDGIAPGIDLILGRLLGDRGNWLGVAAGMSGSPVTVDGKLVGALSYSIGQFAKEPILGITPIGQMLALQDYPGGLLPWGGRPSAAGFSAIPLAVTAPGLAPATLDALGDLFGQLGLETRTAVAVSSAGGENPVQSAMQPGDPVSALLIWGDMKVGASGTITWREGDRLLAFGHPFLTTGRAGMPLAPSEIVWTVPSLYSSFKIARIGEPAGTIEQDRLTAISGRLGPVPAGLPMSVTLRRAGRPEVVRRYQLARDPFLTPLLGTIAFRSTVLDGLGAERDESLRLSGSVTLADGQRLRFGAGTVPGLLGPPDQQLGMELLAKLGELVRPPVPLPEVTGVDLVVSSTEPAGSWTVRRAMPDRLVVRAGETLRVVVDLAGQRGAERREVLALAIPKTVQPGTYQLLAGSSRTLAGEFGSVDEARRRTARSAHDYIAAIVDAPPDDQLEVALARSAEGIVSEGSSYPALPGTVHILLRSRPGGTELYRSRLVREASATRSLDRTVVDAARVSIEILPTEPAR